MVSQVEGPTRSYQASAALAKYRRVRLDNDGKLAYASSSDTDCIGVTDREAFAADEWIAVRHLTQGGTVIVECSEAIAITDTLYAAASGKVATSGTVLHGEPLGATAGDGEWLETKPSAAAILGNIARSALTQDAAAIYGVEMTRLRTWDALATNLPGTAGNDDLGLITGTPGTDAPTLQAGDMGGATISRKAAFEFVLPAEYDAGETITLRVHAGMLTTVADASATLDAEVFVVADTGAVGSDICATAAQSINSLTFANKDFTITPTSRVAGDRLVVILTVAAEDAGDTGVMIPEITNVELLLDVKG